jgi:hypothetical protein
MAIAIDNPLSATRTPSVTRAPNMALALARSDSNSPLLFNVKVYNSRQKCHPKPYENEYYGYSFVYFLKWKNGGFSPISAPFKENYIKHCVFFNIRLVAQGPFTVEVT